MSLNTTPTEVVRQAAIDLAKKMSLESALNAQLRDFFNDVAADAEQSVLRTGGVQDVEQYRSRIQALLTKQSIRVTESFSKSSISAIRQLPFSNPIKESLRQIAKLLGISSGDLLNNIEAESSLTAQQNIAANVIKTTSEILATTQKQLTKSLQQANVSLEPGFTRRELSLSVSAIFRVKSGARPATISTTYTQQAAEQTKFHAQDSVGAVLNSPESRELGLDPVEVQNRWISQGDSRVRDGDIFNHLDADFQIREDGVFRVSGQLLRFPGDTSLGATAANVIRCRCASVMTLERQAA